MCSVPAQNTALQEAPGTEAVTGSMAQGGMAITSSRPSEGLCCPLPVAWSTGPAFVCTLS